MRCQGPGVKPDTGLTCIIASDGQAGFRGRESIQAPPRYSRTTIISICDTMSKTRAGLRPLELGPSTHTLRERAVRGLYNDVGVEVVQGSGACGTTLLRTIY